MQIDHIFIRVQPGGPEAEALKAFGLTEGSGNTHPGQGTANRRFFFANAFLELLWIANEDEVRSPTTSPTTLSERLAPEGTASPFGICFRPSEAGEVADFETWDYQPAYLPPGMAIGIAANTPLTEPMWFFVSKGGQWQQPIHHAAGLREITGIKVFSPSSGQASQAARSSGLTFAHGEQHLLEISYDHEVQGMQKDFRPALPLIFKY
ncbi:Glyoxalase-like domain-containing protein [Duganella sp. CF402]|uniref:VOC family protein n=1 Tax=unclassified Duganella TaxID=2636909 RepID=UPI0008B37FF2|nr:MULTISPECIES: VOC family protein [unclassified Duganella]RZT04085.1 glyoxalase-like protein [Duganella sp. BK701]SEM48813.1 Glyoxalase-like domain-containing protein [Duganella sp. CF402]